MKRFGLQHIYQRFLLTYMSYFLLALLLTVFLHSAATKVIEQYAMDSALSLLDQGRNSIDFQLEQAMGIVDQFAQDYNVQAFLDVKQPMKDADYHALRNLYLKLPYIDMQNSIIDQLLVYYPNSGVIVSPTVVSGQTETVYRRYFQYEAMDWNAWREKVENIDEYGAVWPSHPVTSEGNQMSAVTYIRSILRMYHTDTDGYIVVLVDEESLKQSLDNSLIREGGLTYILDAQGNRIAGVEYGSVADMELDFTQLIQTGTQPDSLLRNDLLVIHTTSNFNGWHYVSVLPKNTLMQPVRSVTYTFLWVLAAGFVLWGAAALIMAKRTSRPIRDIVHLLSAASERKEAPPGNEYDFIRGTIVNLISTNESLTADMEQRQTLVRSAFLDRLLQNGFINADELEQHMQHARMHFTGGWMQVVLLRINGYYGQMTSEMLEEMDNVLVLVRRLLAEQLGDAAHFHQINGNPVILLSAPEPFDTMEEIQRLQTALSQYNILAAFGIGRRCGSATDAWESLDEARLALEATDSRNSIRLFEESPQSNDEYYYPIQTEVRLASLIKLGENAGVTETLQSLTVENFQNRHLSRDKIRLLISEITGTVAKIKDELTELQGEIRSCVDTEMEALGEMPPGKEAFDRSCTLLLSLSSLVAERHELRRQDLRDDMHRYLQENYADPDLCLYSMAKHFNLVEKYFSRFFKEQMGVNFSGCLEQIRMDKARELLDVDSLSVTQIAQAVGYLNMNTFYKAFKRTFGVSPRMYKNGP